MAERHHHHREGGAGDRDQASTPSRGGRSQYRHQSQRPYRPLDQIFGNGPHFSLSLRGPGDPQQQYQWRIVDISQHAVETHERDDGDEGGGDEEADELEEELRAVIEEENEEEESRVRPPSSYYPIQSDEEEDGEEQEDEDGEGEDDEDDLFESAVVVSRIREEEAEEAEEDGEEDEDDDDEDEERTDNDNAEEEEEEEHTEIDNAEEEEEEDDDDDDDEDEETGLHTTEPDSETFILIRVAELYGHVGLCMYQNLIDSNVISWDSCPNFPFKLIVIFLQSLSRHMNPTSSCNSDKLSRSALDSLDKVIDAIPELSVIERTVENNSLSTRQAAMLKIVLEIFENYLVRFEAPTHASYLQLLRIAIKFYEAMPPSKLRATQKEIHRFMRYLNISLAKSAGELFHDWDTTDEYIQFYRKQQRRFRNLSEHMCQPFR